MIIIMTKVLGTTLTVTHSLAVGHLVLPELYLAWDVTHVHPLHVLGTSQRFA